MMRRLFAGLLLLSTPGWASTYFGVVDCGQLAAGENFCVQGLDGNGDEISPSAVVHPPGFTDTSSNLTIKVCNSTAGNSELLEPATKRAMALWNGLLPTTDNCTECTLPEDPWSGSHLFFAESAVLHEMGHCAMGLGHPNLQFDDPDDGFEGRVLTSFANSYGGAQIGIDVGLDGVRGSSDDEHLFMLGQLAKNVTWAREVDNDPFVIDSLPIDIDSYTRTVTMLQVGSWATNGNTCVSALLGRGTTKAVMNSPYGPFEAFFGLAADDVNGVKMGTAGIDREAGTGDDYTITLEYVETCVGADVQVSFADLGDEIDDPIAECLTSVYPSQEPPHPPIILHYSLQQSAIPAMVRLNSNVVWILDPPGALVFADGFESADTSEWSDTVPARTKTAPIEDPEALYVCPITP